MPLFTMCADILTPAFSQHMPFPKAVEATFVSFQELQTLLDREVKKRLARVQRMATATNHALVII